MPVTFPRRTPSWKSLATSRMGTLMTLFCIMCLAAGTPVQKEAGTSHRQQSAESAPRSSERPAAHFQADPHDPNLNLLTWAPGVDNSFTQGELTLRNNQLHIEQKGLYFIYTQATFGGTQCPQDNNLVSLSVILESVEHGQGLQILRADKTPCELPGVISANKGTRAGWNKSIFQGGAFKLERGDKVYVLTVGTKYIKRENGATYFGAYAL
ncbi:lymphotoxin-alpha-like [Hyla sarda]|uniref:lymphotoxin-alpha-like n=1 Tax=Hyla sarda TaxID=327740 RepID=UPI0024C3EEB7|nr:lymphotoxin-alpha-like [Hyla sarda]XP_056395348.1 lymphotoxin-alpha-like [Hyla sarda]